MAQSNIEDYSRFMDPNFWQQPTSARQQPEEDLSRFMDPAFWETPKPSITQPREYGMFGGTAPQIPKFSITEGGKTHEILMPEKPTSITALAKASYAKKPQTKIKIFAKARGIPESQYRVVDNEIVFKENGKYYQEGARRTRRALTEFAVDPKVIGGLGLGTIAATAGAATPLVTAGAGILGAMGGEYARQEAARTNFGETLPLKEAIGDIGQAAIEGAVGEGIGYGLTKAAGVGGRLAQSLNPRGDEITGRAQKALKKWGFLEQKNINSIRINQNRANKKYGIQLNMVESLENEPRSGVLAGIAKKDPYAAIERNKQIEASIPKFIKEVLPSWKKTIVELKEQPATKEYIKESGTAALKGLKKEGEAITRPIYEGSFLDAPHKRELIPEITRNIDMIANRYLKDTKENLLNLKRILPHRKIGKNYIPVANLRDIDRLKGRIDKMVVKNPTTKQDEDWNNALYAIKDKVVTYGDTLSPQYRSARAVHALINFGYQMENFAKTSSLTKGEIKKYANKGELRKQLKRVFEDVESIKPEKVRDIGTYILDSTRRSPSVIKAVKNATINYGENGKQIWDQAFGDYIQFEAGKILKKADKQTQVDFGYELWRKILGNEHKRQNIKAALEKDEYKNFVDVFEVLRKTGKVFGRGFTQPEFDIPGHRLLKRISQTARPLHTAQSVGLQEFTRGLRERDIKSLIKLIYSKDTASELTRIKNMPTIEEKINSLMRLAGWGITEIPQRYAEPSKE